MNTKALIQPKFNLLEKKYLASRIACLILTTLLIMYLLPIPSHGITALLVSGGLAVLLTIQFFRQSPALNFILGGIMFLIGVYFCFAVMSEFNDFETVTRSAKQLLIVGLGACFSVMVLAFLMISCAMRAQKCVVE